LRKRERKQEKVGANAEEKGGKEKGKSRKREGAKEVGKTKNPALWAGFSVTACFSV
jgi:hypothetical protein